MEEFPTVGAVPKDYLTYGDPNKSGSRGYFAKKGRLKNGDARECVTEEIISKIGAELPLEMAESKLVRIDKTDVRFLSENFVVPERNALVHGSELAAQYLNTNQEEMEEVFDLRDRESESNFYTVPLMLDIFQRLYPDNHAALKTGFLKMIAFDAFIGAPDRHAMNWGVLEPTDSSPDEVRFSPIFDTARGLFREYSDSDWRSKIQKKGRFKFIREYAEKSKPVFRHRENEKVNHFTLFQSIVEGHSDQNDIESMVSVIDSVDIPRIEDMLQKRFRRIITQGRIKLIKELLSYRVECLREVIRK